MEDWRRKKIEDVYSKWERKSRPPNPKNVSFKQVQTGMTTSRGTSTNGSSNGTSSISGGSRSSKSVTIRAPRYSSSSSSRASRQKEKIAQQLEGGLANGSVLSASSSFVPSLGVSSSELHASSDLKYLVERRCCLKCLPRSRVEYVAGPQVMVGLNNVLLLDRSDLGFFGRLFPLKAYRRLCHMDFTMRDLRPDIISSNRVNEAIISCTESTILSAEEDSAELHCQALQKQQRRALKIITGMSAALSSTLLRLMLLLTTWTFGKLFNKIQVPWRHAAMLKKAQEKGLPMVYLPGHKSHLDYILVTYILLRLGLPVPRIAAGENLRIPLVSWLITHLGGFFIKRKLDNGRGKDVLYRMCLHEFIERSLCDGEGIEIFIEGSRSRSGKVNSPKAGLLSVIVDSVKRGVIDDVMVVPVGISYDKLIERKFIRHELMGGTKKKENFMEAVRGAWAILTSRSGSVRVDFGQPFSVKEYLENCSIADCSQMELTNVSMSRSVVNMADLGYRKVVTALSHHAAYDITQCTSLMPTSIVSFLLLTKFRWGITEEKLIKGYIHMEEIAKTKNRSVGFTGEAAEAVHYALTFLAPLLTMDEQTRVNGKVTQDLVIKPRLELPDVFELLHHANQVTPLLALEAVLACSVYAIVGEKLRVRPFPAVEVSRDELIREAIQLCRILSREFIFAPPCVGLADALEEALDFMIRTDLLRMPEQVMNPVYPGRKLPRLQGVSDEEDNWDQGPATSIMLQINAQEQSLLELAFLRGILNPYLETYWHSCLAVLKIDHVTEEINLLKEVHENLIQKARKGLLLNVESCSMDLLRNSVKVFVDLNYVAYKDTRVQVMNTDGLTEVVLNRLNSYGH